MAVQNESLGSVEFVALEGLKEGAMGGLSAFLITAGTWAPALAISISPLAVWFVAGNGTWLAFIISVVAIMGLALCVNVFAKRYLATGGMYSWIELVMGRRGRVVMAALIAGSNFCVMLILVPQLSLYGSPFMTSISPGLAGNGAQFIITGVVIAVCALFVIRGVEESVRVMWIIVGVSLPIVLVLMIAAAIKSGVSVSDQLSLKGVNASMILRGMLIATFGFMGFEQVASLAFETRNPLKNLPRILYGIPLAFLLLYLLGTFLQVGVFDANADAIFAGASPVTVLGDASGLPWLGTAASVALFVSVLGVVVGLLGICARYLGTFATDGLLPRVFARVSEKYQTPVIGIVILALIAWIVPWVVIFATGKTSLTIYVWAGSLLTFWFIPAYIMMAVGAVILLRRLVGRVSPLVVLGAVVGTAGMVAMFADAFIHPGAGLLKYVPYLFLGLAFFLIVAFSLASRRRAQAQ